MKTKVRATQVQPLPMPAMRSPWPWSGEPPRPWGPYSDIWALLNASPGEIREVAKSDPAAAENGWGDGWPDFQIDRLNQILELQRTVYKLIASGHKQGESAELLETQCLIMDLRYRFFIEPAGMDIGSIIAKGNKFIVTRAGGKREVWGRGNLDKDAVSDLLEAMFWIPLSATESDIYVCEHCGRIGPAKQTNKRYCNSTCRVYAFRQRQKLGS